MISNILRPCFLCTNSISHALCGGLRDVPAAPFGGCHGHYFRQRASSVRPILPKRLIHFVFSQKVVLFVELFLDITLLLTLARNSYRSGGAGTFFWDTPGVLPAAPRALPGHSWTHLGPPRRCVLSSFRPKRHLSTPHVAKRMVEFVSAYAQYCQNG